MGLGGAGEGFVPVDGGQLDLGALAVDLVEEVVLVGADAGGDVAPGWRWAWRT
jgi:hypothetical protein